MGCFAGPNSANAIAPGPSVNRGGYLTPPNPASSNFAAQAWVMA